MNQIFSLIFGLRQVNTTCYTQNRTLINKDHDKTPYEMMAKKKPTLKYFYVFGAKCFVLKDGEHLGKFDVKADEGIFLGYSLESKAYRVYVIEHQKVVESLNVTFDDTKLPSLQRDKDSEVLEFQNMTECTNEEEDEPVITTGNNGNDDNDSS